jgi:hypothetical protein
MFRRLISALAPFKRTRTIRIGNVPDDLELAHVARRPSVADVLARAGAHSGGAEREAIVAAVRAGRDCN